MPLLRDAVSPAENRAGAQPIRKSQTRSDVVDVGVDEAGHHRDGRRERSQGTGSAKPAVGLRIRQRQVIPEPQAHGEPRIPSPVVFKVGVERVRAETRGPSHLQRGLLRSAK